MVFVEKNEKVIRIESDRLFFYIVQKADVAKCLAAVPVEVCILAEPGAGQPSLLHLLHLKHTVP